MEFKKFNQKIRTQFNAMCNTGKLFRADITGRELWEVYISSFEDEKVFRDPESSEHNCNCCKNFIRRYGNIVAISPEGELMTMFSGIGDVEEYTVPAITIDNLIKTKEIKDVFFETYKELNEDLNYESCYKNQDTYKLGIESNLKKYTQEEVDTFGVVNTTTVYEFAHFCINLPKLFVIFAAKSIESVMGEYRDKYTVFKRAMEELPIDTLNLVKDLINQGSLLNGNSHLHAIDAMIVYKKRFNNDSKSNLSAFCWQATYDMNEGVAKFKNTLIGVLCTELAEGKELNKACENWNKRVDPVNYHKASAPITQKQINEAKAFVEENGFTTSFERRLATSDDIKAAEILHLNSGDGKIEDVSIFDEVKATSTRHKKSEFKNIEEVTIEKFMSDILPSCSSIEVYMENRMEGNLVTITKSKDEEAKQITKWGKVASNYSWTFNGNLAGKSQIKQAVKDAGGNVDGILNFRLAWNDSDGRDASDLDAWAREPKGVEIGYSSPYRGDNHNNLRTSCSGQLDVDNQNPGGKLAVENITWNNISSMQEGIYQLWVHQYSARNSQGFKAEVEFNGDIYSYSFDRTVSGRILVADVILKEGEFTINHHLPETNSSRELWNVETNNFHKVNLVCKSPNHWAGNSIGNLHYFFMLEKCKAEGSIRGFHNENLLPELLKHRKVMEVLGATNMIEPKGKQLSGVGFNSTVKDELIVKCSGSFRRMIKVKI